METELKDGQDGTWGVTCPTHGLDRSGLTQRHATNLMAKHERESHGATVMELDLYAAATQVVQAGLAYSDALATNALMPPGVTARLDLWCVLTGLELIPAIRLAQDIRKGPREHARAAVVPF